MVQIRKKTSSELKDHQKAAKDTMNEDLSDGGSAENEDVVEDEAVEDTDDFGDDDTEDVTEDDDDNVVKDDSLGDDKASEDESFEDTEDLGDDDAEDVTEDDDKLDDEDVNVTALSTCGHSDVLLPLRLLFLQPLKMYLYFVVT